MAKKNASRNPRVSPVTNRGAFALNPGPSQRRSTVPMKTISNGQMAAFNAPVVYTSPVQNLRSRLVNYAKNEATNLAHEYVSQLPPITIPMVQKKVNEAKGYIEKVFSGKVSSKGTSSGHSSYGLSKAPDPKKVKLTSGIIPNTYTQDYMYAVENLCDTLHISSGLLGLPTATNNPLNSYFTQTVAFDIQSRAQANVGFDIGVGSNFSATNIQTAMNAAIVALQVYYYYTGILSYESDPSNKNEGMIYLRQQISASQIDLIVQLGRRLEDTPVPPRVVQWVKYMSANYFSGDTQGSAILKIAPTRFYIFNTDSAAVTNLGLILTSITTGQNSTVFALLRRAIPQWRIGRLTDVTTTPNYDPNFKTIFSNLPFQVWNGTAAVYTPTVSDSTASISYNTFTNKLDGGAFAMSGMYNSALSTTIPGLITATSPSNQLSSTYTSTRWSWGVQSAVSGFYPSDFSIFHTASRQDSYQVPTVYSSVYTPHLFGADKCMNVNTLSTIQTAMNFLDFLFDLDSIPLKGTLNSFNRKANGKI